VWRRGEVHTRSRREPKGDHLEYLAEDGRIILKLILMKRHGSMDWIYVAQDRDRWGDFVNTE